MRRIVAAGAFADGNNTVGYHGTLVSGGTLTTCCGT
jgi:hypothetical protein